MKISRPWLQTYFEQELPDVNVLADALTFHAFEIESIDGEILDVKVTANRGHDCLCHRGIAKELSAILDVPLKDDGFSAGQKLEPVTDLVSVSIDEPSLCSRYVAGYIQDVKVGPSPDWLRNFLESIGQRSINNVVDATNYVMFNLGQPLHAFDAGNLSQKGESFAIAVRKAKAEERMVALDGKEYTLADSMLVITDAHTKAPIGIAGVKGGAPAAITEDTTDIIIESANFDGISVRKTSQALKLRTDASSRFEQVISPEIAGFAMRAVADLIVQLAEGTVIGFVDQYPSPQEMRHVSVTVQKINSLLGTALTQVDVEGALKRLNFSFANEGDTFTVTPPLERLDLVIEEDLVEEVGRIIGYDNVPSAELPGFPGTTLVNVTYYSVERTREEMLSQGYSEVFTSVFAEKGDRVVLNKVDGVRPYLRKSLLVGLKDAYDRNMRIKDLLGLPEVNLFEIGVVWDKGEEKLMLGIADKKGVRENPVQIQEAPERYDDLPLSGAVRYVPFSRYPFIMRDIAIWVPDTDEARGELVFGIFKKLDQDLIRNINLFDQYKKDGRNSLAFHLAFQSYEKTLTDEEVNAIMERIYAAVKERGWEVR